MTLKHALFLTGLILLALALVCFTFLFWVLKVSSFLERRGLPFSDAMVCAALSYTLLLGVTVIAAGWLL